MLSGSWLPPVNRRLQVGIFLLVAALAGIAGFYFNRAGLNPHAVKDEAHRVMLESFPDLSGKSQAMSQWSGKVLVLNFWATWCAPCREEIPALMNVQHKYASRGVKIVGIAVDNVAKVRDYADKMSIDYVLLIAGIEALDLSKDLGNGTGVLPFTVVLDRSGRVAYSHAGALTEVLLGPILTPLL
jgi:thiol-disulfide isomerase/thioredoxin